MTPREELEQLHAACRGRKKKDLYHLIGEDAGPHLDFQELQNRLKDRTRQWSGRSRARALDAEIIDDALKLLKGPEDKSNYDALLRQTPEPQAPPVNQEDGRQQGPPPMPPQPHGWQQEPPFPTQPHSSQHEPPFQPQPHDWQELPFRPQPTRPVTWMHCATCGGQFPASGPTCPRCGAPYADLRPTASGWSRGMAATLCILGFLGLGGVHRFYVGKVGTGVLMLLTYGGGVIWTLIDLIRILAGTFTDREGLPLLAWFKSGSAQRTPVTDRRRSPLASAGFRTVGWPVGVLLGLLGAAWLVESGTWPAPRPSLSPGDAPATVAEDPAEEDTASAGANTATGRRAAPPIAPADETDSATSTERRAATAAPLRDTPPATTATTGPAPTPPPRPPMVAPAGQNETRAPTTAGAAQPRTSTAVGQEAEAEEPAEPDPPAVVEPVRIAGNVPKPRKTWNVTPEYPRLARLRRIEGIVILEVTVNRDGNVSNVSLLRSPEGLEDAAINAVRQWRYEPTIVNERPVSVIFSETVRFQM